MDEDMRQWGSTERGFLLHGLLLERPRKATEIAKLLGYASDSGANNLLHRMRTAKLVRDDDGFWYIAEDAWKLHTP